MCTVSELGTYLHPCKRNGEHKKMTMVKGVLVYLLVIFIGVDDKRLAFAQVSLKMDFNSVNVAEDATFVAFTSVAGCDPGPCTTVSFQRLSPSSPCDKCFSVQPCNTNKFCLYFNRVPPGYLSFSRVPRYTVRVEATNADGDTDTALVDVHVKPDTPPYFDDTHVTSGKLLVKKDFTQASAISVKAVDDEEDGITYTMVTSPTAKTVALNSLSGEIQATQDTQYECREYVYGEVYAKQTNGEASGQAGPLPVALDLKNSNTPPTINNVNSELSVREDVAVGDTIWTFATYDEGSLAESDDVEYIFTTVPSSALDLFEISLKGTVHTLQLKNALDYETMAKKIVLNVKVKDKYCESEENTMILNVVDVNEPPVLLPVDQTVESCEGLVTIKPNWNLTDPDIGDTARFTLIEPNDQGRFLINEETGWVSTAIDYDLDIEKMASTVVATVTVSDKQLATSTATLTIRFRDCNDNTPYFDIPTGRAGKEYLVRDCWEAQTVVANVPNAIDEDSEFNQNNVLSYSGSGDGAEVLDSGSIRITEKFKAGQTSTFAVYATDQGKEPGPLTSQPFYVSLHGLPCFVPDPTDSDNDNSTLGPNDLDFFKANLGWFIPLLLLAALLLPLLAYMLWRHCYPWMRRCCARRRNWCKKPPPNRMPMRKITPPTPPPEKPKPGFIFGFWKETYPDADYKCEPERDAIPEPTGQIDEKIDTNTYDPVPEPEPEPVRSSPQSDKSCQIL